MGARWRATRSIKVAVAFIHGVMGSHHDFDLYGAYFASRGHNAYAFSRRGRLDTPPRDARNVTFGDYLEDTFRAIEAINEDVVVVGHSLGGLIAQKVAEAGRCRAAVLLASAPPRRVRARPAASTIPFYSLAIPKILFGRPYRLRPRALSFTMMQHMTPQEQRALQRRLVPESGRVGRALFRGIAVDPARVRCPMLVVAGANDRVYPPRVSAGIAKYYGAASVVVPDVGHWLLEGRHWQRGAETILEWLQEQ